jgi:hypothetical protein
MTIMPISRPYQAPFSRIRRNHALEHATLHVLTQHNPRRHLAGYSDLRGFWIAGEVDTQDLQEAVDEALLRLQSGERQLAIHPQCGTNLVSSGIVAGSLGCLGLLTEAKDWRGKLDRWASVIALVTIGIAVAQPLGPFLQATVTTQAQVGSLAVVGINRYQRGEMPLHRVLTHG